MSKTLAKLNTKRNRGNGAGIVSDPKPRWLRSLTTSTRCFTEAEVMLPPKCCALMSPRHDGNCRQRVLRRTFDQPVADGGVN